VAGDPGCGSPCRDSVAKVLLERDAAAAIDVPGNGA